MLIKTQEEVLQPASAKQDLPLATASKEAIKEVINNFFIERNIAKPLEEETNGPLQYAELGHIWDWIWFPSWIKLRFPTWSFCPRIVLEDVATIQLVDFECK